MFSKFAEISFTVWAIIAALILLGIVAFVSSRTKKQWTVRMLANASLCIALAFILSMIRLYRLPQGGSITLASMLPLFLFSYAYGVGPGFLVGTAYGVLQFIQSAYFVHPIELLLDYILCYAMLGLCGISHNSHGKFSMVPGMILGTLGRFFCAFLAGVIFFGSYAPEGQNVLIYSAVYNGLYLIPEVLICIVLSMVPQIRTLARQLSQQA